jgi:3-methyl-2-oxobutanoate hydroxymethyltransferase
VGLAFSAPAKFVRRFANLSETVREALGRFRESVVSGNYPDDSESYHWPSGLREQFEKEVARNA